MPPSDERELPIAAAAIPATTHAAVPAARAPGADEGYEQDIPVVPPAFCVNDAASANWLVRKICDARAYAAHVAAWAEREKRRAQREEQFFLRGYGPQLQDWASAQIAALQGRRKSLGLPAGTVGFRSAPAKLVVDDERVVLAWARKACPQAIVVEERLSMTELALHLEKTGEIPVDGAHLDDACEKFYVR